MNLIPHYSIYRVNVIPIKKKLHLNLDILLNLVSVYTETPIDALRSKTRKSKIVDIRHIFCYLAWNYTRFPLIEISKKINREDHSTAISARDKIDGLITYDSSIKKTVSKISSVILTNYITQKRV